MIETVYLYLLIVSFGLNLILIFCLIYGGKFSQSVAFDEAFSTLNSVIDTYRNRFNFGLQVLSKKHAVMNNTGQMIPPNNSVAKYVAEKKNLKMNITKKVVRSISRKTRRKILDYYTEPGLVDYIVFELDKDDVVPGDDS